MKKVLCLFVLLMAVICVNPVWSFDLTDHVKIAPNLKGDLLFYPSCYAEGNFATKLTLVNTDPNREAVAKLVVRGGIYSTELLDFLIYLSPADVWTGVIENIGGNVQMRSEDDSCLINKNTFASAGNPFIAPLTPRCSDIATLTYVEVFEVWSRYIAAGPGRSKTLVKSDYDGAPAGNLGPGMPDEAQNILTGSYEIYNSELNLTSANSATVMADYDVNAKLAVATETYLGLTSNNTLCEVEAALAQNEISLPYYSSPGKTTFHVFTFPTKLMNKCTGAAPRSNYFITFATAAGLPYSFQYYDLQEKTDVPDSPIISPAPLTKTAAFPNEVNLVTPKADTDLWTSVFTEGWALYRFTTTTGGAAPITYSVCTPRNGADSLRFQNAAPVIAQSVFFTPNNGLSIQPGAGSVENWNAAAGAWAPIIEYDAAFNAAAPAYVGTEKYQYKDN